MCEIEEDRGSIIKCEESFLWKEMRRSRVEQREESCVEAGDEVDLTQFRDNFR